MFRLCMRRIFWGLSLVSFTLSLAELTADTVYLKDGSRLVGRITEMREGQVRLDTDFAGVLQIDRDKVLSFTMASQRKIALESGNILVGTVKRVNEGTHIATSMGDIDISDETVTALWMADEPSPKVRELEREAETYKGTWSYEAAADLSGKSGNTDRFSTSGEFTATLKRLSDRLKFFGAYEKTEEEGQETVDEIEGGIDFERYVTRRHSWYTRVGLEQDDVEGLDLRTEAAFGYGYYWLRSKAHELRTRTGLLLRHESYEGGRNEQSLAFDLGLHHMSELNKRLKVINDITYTPAVDDYGNYRIDHESSLETPLGGSDIWKLRLGVANEYNSQPGPSARKLDTSYFVRLVLGWGE